MEDGKWKGENGKWKMDSILHRPFSNLRSPISSFLQDRRGASLVTYTLILPLLLMLVFGASTIWEIISVKQSMDVATYEAARYLSREGRRIAAQALPYYNPGGWERIAHEEIDGWVQDQIHRNPFVSPADTVEVEIVPPIDVDCNPWYAAPTNKSRAPENIRFTVTARLRLKSSIQIPFVGSPATFTLLESHSDLVECRRFRSRPPDEGEIFFPRTRSSNP